MFRNKPLITFDQKQSPSPLLRTAEVSALGLGFVATHRYAMKSIPKFAERAHNLFTKLEDISPGHIFRTFGLSELYSSYLPKLLEIQRKDIFAGADFTSMGEHLQRMLGNNLNLREALSEEKPLRFIRTSNGSAYMKLQGAEHVQVRFFGGIKVGEGYIPGRIAASSQRLGAPLENAPFDWLSSKSISRKFKPIKSTFKDTPFKWTSELLKNIGKAQHPSPIYKEVIGRGFQPAAVRIAGKPITSLANTGERVSFLMAERAQSLMSDIRLGLWKGSYNKLFHIPFSGGPEKGIVNELLTKRALPIYAGVIGLGYLDYLTHHVVSNTGIELYQQSRVFHAKLTDKIPGFRAITDAYADVIPGPQYGPIALPLTGLTAGALYHLSKTVLNRFPNQQERKISSRIFAEGIEGASPFLKVFNKRSPLAIGLVTGLAAMLPLIPGMLGSRKTARELQDIYSGQESVPVKSGRWWDLGTTPWEGNRIKAFRPHWTVLHKSHAEQISLYGSEEEYWAHNPLIHPLRWLRDPYWLERRNYESRPYPVSSPAFSNVPLVGPLLASTIGKLIKPPVRMHPQWTGDDYDIGSSRLQPKGPDALPPATPKPEFGLKDTIKREALQFSELIGLPGFIARTVFGNIYPDKNFGKDVYFQGSRAMESISRKYYEKELGAGLGPHPDLSQTLGYSEPLRRFIQQEPRRTTVNEIPNTMPSWLPGKDYFLNFKVGDAFTKISEGYARLPGAGYEALHPEVKGMYPESYPDIVKLSILGDVAPYSVEYRRMEATVQHQTFEDVEKRIEFEKIVNRVRVTKESVVKTDDRRFSKEITKAKGVVSRVSNEGIELSEFPGRKFKLSSVGYSAADQSAIILGEHNDWSKAQVASEINKRRGELIDFFNTNLSPGTEVSITVPKGSLDSQEDILAVFDIGNTNVNKSLILQGLGRYRKDLGGAESQAMFGWLGQAFGRASEELSFTGDEARWNPLRYIPSPYHTKFWQERTTLAQYQQQEVEGSRLRRWQHPIEDFLMPYARGAYRRVVGKLDIPEVVQIKWDLNTMSDMLDYVRDMKLAASDPSLHGRYTNQASRTAIGANLFGKPTFVASTFNGRDNTYFQRFITESDPDERGKILASVPSDMARALSAQWAARESRIASNDGKITSELGEGGRLYSEEGLQEYEESETKLNYGDFQRSKEIAEFFASHNLNLPEDTSSPLYNPAIDYEDVKLKIVQQEGYDTHDFGLFDDRAALLWRKPYVDGAIRELTSPDNRSVEQIRRSVEEMILAAHDKNPQVIITSNSADTSRANVRIDISLDQQEKLLQDMRRNPEHYK